MSEVSTTYDVQVIHFPKSEMIGVTGIGEYEVTMKKNCGVLFKFFGERNIKPGQFAAFFFDNPIEVPEEKLKSVAAVKVTSEQLASLSLSGDEPVEPIVWEEGDYAVVVYTGPYSGLIPLYDYIFGVFLPKIFGRKTELQANIQ
ncbi:hypothetical protein PPL_10904 [Heterostelium album PN500]|uniref:GyrI-like small molecule binding domain-containing protein n=1 Tax=Heterostelium pallidum (strain ATCC 26659 / Pp 5 / PN500) TaxID=670386 RepID=D3BSD7_HETP5|nr:hypothetical protein PPL_10904 [Heterostelium album PN500]EFA75643.1 hypothetical protein PPL_10904 [Heterostelium album PN500]|eukprot:XP_020427777.1 hypothetical protein PPL_10904 [Heterostelium album PN500]